MANGVIQILASDATITIANVDFPIQTVAAADGGSGDVLASGTLTDNALIKGGGVKTVQATGITVDDSDNITGVTTLGIDATYTPTGSEPVGTLLWNTTENGLDYVIDAYGNITIGQEIWDYLTNLSGGELVNGNVVSITGATGNRQAMSKTDATNAVSSLACVGIVTVPSIANNNKGRITKLGPVRGVNTLGYTEGQLVYADCVTPGAYTQDEPASDCYRIEIGVCTVAHETEGVIDVRIRTALSLADLSLINGTALSANGQVPVWNNTAGYWDFDYNITDYKRIDDDAISTLTPAGSAITITYSNSARNFYADFGSDTTGSVTLADLSNGGAEIAYLRYETTGAGFSWTFTGEATVNERGTAPTAAGIHGILFARDSNGVLEATYITEGTIS